MLNRILGRTKAKELTAEEIQQVAGAGCRTVYYTTLICTNSYSPNGDPSESTCVEWDPVAYSDPFTECN